MYVAFQISAKHIAGKAIPEIGSPTLESFGSAREIWRNGSQFPQHDIIRESPECIRPIYGVELYVSSMVPTGSYESIRWAGELWKSMGARNTGDISHYPPLLSLWFRLLPTSRTPLYDFSLQQIQPAINQRSNTVLDSTLYWYWLKWRSERPGNFYGKIPWKHTVPTS